MLKTAMFGVAAEIIMISGIASPLFTQKPEQVMGGCLLIAVILCGLALRASLKEAEPEAV